MNRFRIAVDIGGTFVDAVEFDQNTGGVRLRKAPTTPGRPAEGVLEAIRRLGTPLAETELIVHGTTLGLNAIIERKGAVTGIITNAGFRDLFEIGRADVPREHMYDFAYQRPAPLVRRRHGSVCAAASMPRESVVEPLDEKGVREAAAPTRSRWRAGDCNRLSAFLPQSGARGARRADRQRGFPAYRSVRLELHHP